MSAAATAQAFDLWLVKSNSVYQGVPFDVVADWLQQSRLLPDDRARPAGSEEWMLLTELPALRAFLPKAAPKRVEDAAEALEPVQFDFGWKKPKPDDDDDVDMIPLIDISLVLLIYFMMTAQPTDDAVARPPLPEGINAVEIADVSQTVRVNIDDKGGSPKYTVVVGNKVPHESYRDLGTEQEAAAKVKEVVDQRPGVEVPVHVAAAKSSQFGKVKSLTAELSKLNTGGKTRVVLKAEVNAKQ